MFVNQAEIGRHFGGTSHDAGRWLDAIGLRQGSNKPTPRAFAEGFVTQADHKNGGYFYVWDRDKTIAAHRAQQ